MTDTLFTQRVRSWPTGMNTYFGGLTNNLTILRLEFAVTSTVVHVILPYAITRLFSTKATAPTAPTFPNTVVSHIISISVPARSVFVVTYRSNRLRKTQHEEYGGFEDCLHAFTRRYTSFLLCEIAEV